MALSREKSMNTIKQEVLSKVREASVISRIIKIFATTLGEAMETPYPCSS